VAPKKMKAVGNFKKVNKQVKVKNEMLEKIVNYLNDKKGEDIRIFNVKENNGLWDYFVVCTGTSTTHVKALRDFVSKEMKQLGYSILYKDSGLDSSWVVVDMEEVLVHIFDKDTREYYSLERLWGDVEENAGAYIK